MSRNVLVIDQRDREAQVTIKLSSSKALTVKSVTRKYGKYLGGAVDFRLTRRDGTVLGDDEAAPGTVFVAPSSSSEGVASRDEGAAETEEGASSERRCCRYCFEDEEPLIAPCECRGDQRWVHPECLKRWQRSLLLDAPTHPALVVEDPRTSTCGVCKGEFGVPPLTRLELMASFTGPELAARLSVDHVLCLGGTHVWGFTST